MGVGFGSEAGLSETYGLQKVRRASNMSRCAAELRSFGLRGI